MQVQREARVHRSPEVPSAGLEGWHGAAGEEEARAVACGQHEVSEVRQARGGGVVGVHPGWASAGEGQRTWA
jgi:hypothetical protein